MNPELKDKICRAHYLSYNESGEMCASFKNINALLKERKKKNGSELFLRYSASGKYTDYTYDSFVKKVWALSDFLLMKGIKKENRLAVYSHNHADTVILYFAAWNIGAAVVPLNISEGQERIEFILKNSDTKILFTRNEYAEDVKRVCGELNIHQMSFDNLVIDEYESSPSSGYDTDGFTEAMIVYTSGTTGNPKGVVLYQYNLLCDAHFIADWHHLYEKDRMMCVLPIHHVNGTVVTLMTPMYYGGSVVLNDRFHAESFFDLLEENDVKVVSVVPTLLRFLMHAHENKKIPGLKRFRHFICGAGPLTSELARGFEEQFGLRVVHGYGLSETTCYSCFIPDGLSKEEHYKWQNEYGFPSIGIPLKCNEMDIQNPDGSSVPEGARGEIVIRGHNVMKYYFDNDTANESAFSHNWFRSGDEGFYKYDGDGNKFFFITGRIKELIIRGGVNISPLEIDEVLSGIKYVKSAISVGFENEWYGEEVGALVSLKDEYTVEDREVIEKEIINHCEKHLPFNKSPKVIIFTDNIPVTSTGKYKRNEAKKYFEDYRKIQFRKGKN
ncbi:MAG: acyl--CoA ligase [Bacteroidetes bacterium]|nr:acyl--CoA ligase [Bacteroidota bacterium]